MPQESRKIRAGFIFKDKYGVDPRKLTLGEINYKVFKKEKATISTKHKGIVATRGNVFSIRKFEDAEEKVSRLLD